MLKRLALALGILLAPVFLRAQDLGTKADIVTSVPRTQGVTAGPQMGQFLTLMVALGIAFVALKFWAPKMIGKFNKRLTTPLGSPITLEESANFATGNLQVVTVRGKSLLLAITPQGVTFLAEVPSKAPDDPVPAFFELLDQQSVEPKPQKIVTKAVVEMQEDEPAEVKPDARVKAYGAAKSGDVRDDLKSRLEKLQRITKG
ncbi:hypothetical protein C0431_00380 [bacterium]|nr:hypothetical protein [bacterium]